MGKRLIDLTTQEEREKALANTEKLDDFEYPPDISENTNIFEDTNIPEHICLPEKEKDRDRAYWTNVATIACIRFPKLQGGESIKLDEIRKRLRLLRKADYEVPAYGKMGKRDLWNSLIKIRRNIYIELEKNYPDIKRQIESINHNIR
jgi:hypothetical protein